MADPLDLRLDENPPDRTPTGLYLVRLADQLKDWGHRLLNNVPRRWTPRYEVSSVVYCQPWDFARLGSSVSTVRLPDPATCPGASVVLVPDTYWGPTTVVSSGGVHVDGAPSLALLASWPWVELTSHGAATADGARGGWRSKRSANVRPFVAQADPSVYPPVGQIDVRASAESEADVLVMRTSVEDQRILTTPRVGVGSVRETHLTGSVTTSDSSTWHTIVELPIRGASTNVFFEAELIQETSGYEYEKLWGARRTSGGVLLTSYLKPGATTLTSTHGYIQVVDPGSGTNIHLQVKSTASNTLRWTAHVRIVGETV